MYAKLMYKLPEEHEEHLAAIRGSSYKAALFEMDNYFRNRLKYEELPNDIAMALQEAREKLNELVQEAEE